MGACCAKAGSSGRTARSKFRVIILNRYCIKNSPSAPVSIYVLSSAAKEGRLLDDDSDGIAASAAANNSPSAVTIASRYGESAADRYGIRADLLP